MANDFKKQSNYKDLEELREKITEDLKILFPTQNTIDFMKLVEMRVQTTIMAGVFDDNKTKK